MKFNELIKQSGITLTRESRAERPWLSLCSDTLPCSWHVTLFYKKRSMSFDFYTGIGHKTGPTVEICLEALIMESLSYEPDFQTWCYSVGLTMEEQSNRGTLQRRRKIHENLKKQSEMLERFLGNDYAVFVSAFLNPKE